MIFRQRRSPKKRETNTHVPSSGSNEGSPGTTAARMFVTSDGVRYGTIGGGVMEKRVIDEAIAILNQDPLPNLGYANCAIAQIRVINHLTYLWRNTNKS